MKFSPVFTSRPNIALKPQVMLTNPEVLEQYVESVGKFSAVCYADSLESINDMDSEKFKKIGMGCLNSGHMSGARHQYLTFEVWDVSRSFSHQLVRHTVGVEINQRSQRYVAEKMPRYYIPSSIAGNKQALDVYEDAMQKAWSAMYDLRVLHDIPQEDLRELLPNATLTELNVAVSMQALIHLCEERLCNRVSFQFRSVVQQMAEQVIAIEPLLAPLLQCKCDKLGYCTEAKSCGKYKKREV